MRFAIMISCLILLIFSTLNTYAKIVFKTGDSIYIMDDDGSNVMPLTEPLFPGPPQWSPDGKEIVFSRRDKPTDPDQTHIYLMNADGTNIRQLTTPKDSLDDYHPSFSPDGKSIVFARIELVDNKYTPSLCVMEMKNGKIKIKKRMENGINDPVFSSDGTKIMFSGSPGLGRSGANIYIMDAINGAPRELLPPLKEENPLFITRLDARISPDGTQMLYWQSETTFEVIDKVGHIIPQTYRYFIYNLITGQSQELGIPKNYKCAGVDWMDGNKSVVFSAWPIKLGEPVTKEQNYNLYKYEIWSGKITQLTNEQGRNDNSPDWISDQVLSISPQDKKNVKWGTIKNQITD